MLTLEDCRGLMIYVHCEEWALTQQAWGIFAGLWAGRSLLIPGICEAERVGCDRTVRHHLSLTNNSIKDQRGLSLAVRESAMVTGSKPLALLSRASLHLHGHLYELNKQKKKKGRDDLEVARSVDWGVKVGSTKE